MNQQYIYISTDGMTRRTSYWAGKEFRFLIPDALLFILFCNDIQYLPLYGHLILFADDTTLLSSQKSIKFLKYTLQHDMELLTQWFKANQLSLNMVKTMLVRFWPDNGTFTIEVNSKHINEEEATKFLGIIVDNKLTWSHHIAFLAQLISCAIINHSSGCDCCCQHRQHRWHQHRHQHCRQKLASSSVPI